MKEKRKLTKSEVIEIIVLFVVCIMPLFLLIISEAVNSLDF